VFTRVKKMLAVAVGSATMKRGGRHQVEQVEKATGDKRPSQRSRSAPPPAGEAWATGA
jgi:hypothetical protein